SEYGAGKPDRPVPPGGIGGRAAEIAQHGVRRLRFGSPVVPVNGRADGLRPGRDEAYPLVEDERELVLNEEVGRVGGGAGEGVAVEGQREDQVFSGHRLGDELDDGPRRVQVRRDGGPALLALNGTRAGEERVVEAH